jgi:hypothetical protein
VTTKTKKTSARKLAAPPSAAEQARLDAVRDARRAHGGYAAAIEQALTRLVACWHEEDRLVEIINAATVGALDAEKTIGRAPDFQGVMMPGRRRDIVVELQRRRPTLLENPPLVVPVVAPPPTPEMLERAERARARDAANVRRFNPAPANVDAIPTGVSGL